MNLNDNTLIEIAKYLKLISLLEADKQIAYLKAGINTLEHEKSSYSTQRNIIPIENKINLYNSKIKEYESYFNNQKEVQNEKQNNNNNFKRIKK